jgi:hypothetical protein
MIAEKSNKFPRLRVKSQHCTERNGTTEQTFRLSWALYVMGLPLPGADGCNNKDIERQRSVAI